MKRYYNIDYQAMTEFGLNPVEWMICENIGFLCSITENGYTDKTRAELAEHHGLSVDRMKKLISSLVERGFLKRNKKYQLKIAGQWVKISSLNGRNLPKGKEEKRGEDFPYFVDEFGADEKSRHKDRPSKNQVRARAMHIAKVRKIPKDDAVSMADSFWEKQEGYGWSKIVDFFPLLKRFMTSWVRNYGGKKKKEKEKKIVKPTNAEEMRLFLKQMSDEARAKIKFQREVTNPYGDDVTKEVIVVNHLGFLVKQESGEYVDDVYSSMALTKLCSDYKKFLK